MDIDTALPLVAPTVALTSFFTGWSHRVQHRFCALWRIGHQLHHGLSPVETTSVVIFRPVDVNKAQGRERL